MLLERYDEARLLADAKGWTIETFNGREHLTEIVETGLRVLRGQPTPAPRDPHELALALLAHFPTDEFALKFADALVKQAGQTSGLGALLSALASGITDRLPHVLKLREARLARHLSERLDRLSAKRLALAGAAGGVGGGVVASAAIGLVVAGLTGLLLSGRLQVVAHPAEPAKAAALATITPQPVLIVTSAAQGGTPLVFDLRTLLGAVDAQLGEKVPPEQYVPSILLPSQRPPPCDTEAGEVAVGGGCWVGVIDVKPPCGRKLFRSGDACYRPVAADPRKPVMVSPREPGQEPH